MRVALSGWFWDRADTGSGQYVRKLLAQLVAQERGADFVLVAPPERLNVGAALPHVRKVPLPAPPGAWGKVWWEQVTLPRAVARLGVDLLHVPYWAPPLLTPVPTVTTVHDLIPLLLPAYRGGAAVRLYTALVRFTSRRAALILTDSEASRADILRHLPVSVEQVRAVPLAVEARYAPTAAFDDIRRRRDLGVPSGYVLYLGGFDVRKNLRGVFEAFARARIEVEDALLVVAGRLPTQDTAFTPDPRRLLREVGLSGECVLFIGFVAEQDKPALYRGARAFLYPSRYEGFGLPPLEALACGVPVVGSWAGSLPEVVGAGGVLAAPDDAAALGRALTRLLGDDAFHAVLQRRALQQAARFSWEATAAQTWQVYREATRGATAR
ncbi:MAG: glycosyltransferase family 4 protein [Anaerolineae bacterium]